MENKRQLINGQAQQMVEVKDDSASVFAPPIESAQLNDLKTKIHVKLVDDLLQTEEAVDVNLLLDKFLESENVVLTKSERATLLQELHSEMHGYGPLDALLADNAVSEIMVIAFDQVFIEKNRRLVKTGLQFKDDEHVMRIIEKIVSPLGRRIDESTPFVDARLPDGSRVHAIIPPLALKGPCLTIRKFAKDPFQIGDLINFGTLTLVMAQFLQAAVTARLNVMISGGTGSGKTTLLNILSNFIGSDERIITIEDAAELQLRQEHLVSLETRPPNMEGKGAITIRDLVRNALRMRPDRIVVGEVRGGEALDMLQAMNTGHDGSLTTGHANTPRDILRRLETMVMMAGMELPSRAIREQISSALDLIIQQARMADGVRRVTHVTEVLGMEGEQITLQDIFIFEQTGRAPDGTIQGVYKATGIVPRSLERIEAAGVLISHQWFRTDAMLGR
jgi:pilus assembly protein CpaF